MQSVPSVRSFVASALFAILLGSPGARAAGNYDFLAAPQIDLNRVFRLDRSTGEIGACQFGLKEGSPVGTTLCYPPGQGAGPQGSSDYALIASRHEQEGGVFRVDQRTGMMSICYVLNETVVCTPQAK
ncbi:hypothetical protein [Beijerinckia sp. L45]|uniref:hypothetical protein n=1 Tax=Beijerinckia sp. L45 TaxID=1641855 RepID=UPI001FED634E|nr:hypothetical protein [Beijerinckia sp. L45]